MENCTLEPISGQAAALALSRAAARDPSRIADAASVADSGAAFRLKTPAGEGVLVCKIRGGTQLWVCGAEAAPGAGNLTDAGMALLEVMADENQCDRIAFQTGRPGLVRVAKKHGYKVVGFIMEKSKN